MTRKQIRHAIEMGAWIDSRFLRPFPDLALRYNKKYRDVTINAPTRLFTSIGVKKRPIYADLIKLYSKHPLDFENPGDVRLHIEFVLEEPDHILPASHEPYTLLIRKDSKHKATVVEFVVRGGKYRVISAHVLNDIQVEHKTKKATGKGATPSGAGEHISNPIRDSHSGPAVEPLDSLASSSRKK